MSEKQCWMNDSNYPQDLLKMNDSNYPHDNLKIIDNEWWMMKIVHEIYWRWFRFIKDEWWRLSTKFIEDEWLRLLKMNDLDYP
jgi:hypothetical protein